MIRLLGLRAFRAQRHMPSITPDQYQRKKSLSRQLLTKLLPITQFMKRIPIHHINIP